ncbi:unnamed protein product [Didymodactylos carnosus]|uniref:YHYH domain-containing protein n=1 Tax=Didymodactylos carnosus TaxID=1234261 RepID=A0A815IZH1_9BILA|nr:unnamed protein product [Didymodactylos carnosus]CAF4265713.1 unnamed protein product [Didymodactylos carnosus]
MLVPSFASIAEHNIDFEVNFNPDVSVNAPNQAPSPLSALNNIVCNISNQITVPVSSAYAAMSMFIPVLAGVAVDGVSILNVNSLNQVDPFYPSGNFTPEGADQCLSHPTGMGEYHYHIASGCMVNPPSGNVDGCTPMIGCANNVANYSLQTFSSYKNLTVIGIAKDGHVIYGPYLSSGAQVTSGFDICNGMFYDSIGNYAYFATTTYPYITGCFGPGNKESYETLISTDRWPIRINNININVTQPKFIPDCFALVVRYVLLQYSDDYVEEEIERNLQSPGNIRRIQYRFSRRINDFRFIVKDLREYIATLKLGRISIGSSYCTVPPFLAGNRLQYCTRCWCLGHIRNKFEFEYTRCHICLCNLVDGEAHECSSIARCA